MKKVWIHGLSGRMGLELKKVVDDDSAMQLLGGTTRESSFDGLAQSELVLDFSSPKGSLRLFEEMSSQKLREKRVLIGTTGLDAEILSLWRAYSEKNNCACLFAPNTSAGIRLMHKALEPVVGVAHELDFDIELQEAHHRYKQDAPSGTANALLQTICRQGPSLGSRMRGFSPRKEKTEVGVQVIRGGGVFGEHTVRIMGEHEELVIQHRAFSRALFAEGALQLSRWLGTKKLGMFYELSDVYDEAVAG